MQPVLLSKCLTPCTSGQGPRITGAWYVKGRSGIGSSQVLMHCWVLTGILVHVWDIVDGEHMGAETLGSTCQHRERLAASEEGRRDAASVAHAVGLPLAIGHVRILT